jgi:hypothetical protein
VKYVKKDFLEKKSEMLDKPKIIDFKKMALNKQSTITPEVRNKKNKNMDNTISLKKTYSLQVSESVEHQYITEDLDQLFNDIEFKKKMLKVYQGLNTDINIPRILIVTHGGFIMELLNSIRVRKNIRIKFINDSKNSSLYVFKIYCIICGVVCYSKSEHCRMEYDTILYDDIEHLGPLIKIKNNF